MAVATCSLNVLKLVMLNAAPFAVLAAATPSVTVKPAGKLVTAPIFCTTACETV